MKCRKKITRNHRIFWLVSVSFVSASTSIHSQKTVAATPSTQKTIIIAAAPPNRVSIRALPSRFPSLGSCRFHTDRTLFASGTVHLRCSDDDHSNNLELYSLWPPPGL